METLPGELSNTSPPASQDVFRSGDSDDSSAISEKEKGDNTRYFCAFCESIIIETNSLSMKSVTLPHYGTPQDLISSALRCSLCVLFAFKIRERVSDAVPFELCNGIWEPEEGTRFKPFEALSTCDLTSGMAVIDKGSYPPLSGRACTWTLWMPIRLILNFKLSQEIESSFQESEVGIWRSGNFTSSFPYSKVNSTRDGLSLAKIWLDDCESCHRQCQDVSVPNFVPTRLINIALDRPHLQVMSKTSDFIKYTTLSHCWGAVKRPVLTKERLHSFLNCIPDEAISTTFSDAIFIAKFLGYQYIWIDSLCIMQDDVDDWTRESTSMSNVYGKSALNISAAAARDGSYGCFFTRQEQWQCKIYNPFMTGSTDLIALPNDFRAIMLDDMPLMKREWVLQERILAPRTLHCAASQLFWECNDLDACECLPLGYNKSDYENRSIGSTDDIWAAVKAWENLTSVFSQCALTLPNDKLMAISGIARVTASQNPVLGQYIAGMWRTSLETQLCWYVVHEGGDIARPETYRAPSWSWAASDGRVEFEFLHDCFGQSLLELYITVRDVTINGSSVEVCFGQVTAGVLYLSCGHLLSCNFDYKGQHRDFRRLFVNKDTVIFTDALTLFDAPEVESIDPGAPLLETYLLPTLRNELEQVKGLILNAVEDVKGHYTRIGTFTFTREGAEGFRDLLSSGEGEADGSAYVRIEVDADGKEVKIIHII
ncbi:hypothetical protein VTL71DRAFT_1423 [Oculimacula yallundae]|uniref:Heterokaryon incompatibility domain-containing protein n=1 Tax=Oculimacula yallundae TaxID=86028 RepID=A0ABR4CAM0_9HELO